MASHIVIFVTRSDSINHEILSFIPIKILTSPATAVQGYNSEGWSISFGSS